MLQAKVKKKLRLKAFPVEKFWPFIISVFSVMGALGVGAILILVAGASPLEAYSNMLMGSFGRLYSFGEVLRQATPLIIIGCGIAITNKCNFFNIGAEGQLYMGALMATIVGLTFGEMHSMLIIPLLLVVAFLGGAFWGVIPGILKVKLGTPEIILTISMNYISILFVSQLLEGPLKEPGAYAPYSSPLPTSAQLPILISDTRIHSGFLIAAIIVVLSYVLLRKTVLGFKLKTIGANIKVARAVGINIQKNIVISAIIGGGLAGVAGIIDILAVFHRFPMNLSPGYGYTAIVVSWLGKNNPIGIMLASVFFGALIVGGNSMQRATGIPSVLVSAIQGLVLVFTVTGDYFARKGR